MRKSYTFREVDENKMHIYCGQEFPGFVGNFSIIDFYVDRTLFDLDEYDKSVISDVKLKPNERVFRCSTERSRKIGQSYLVKINTVSGLAYFVIEENESGKVKFESVGSKISYLNLKK